MSCPSAHPLNCSESSTVPGLVVVFFHSRCNWPSSSIIPCCPEFACATLLSARQPTCLPTVLRDSRHGSSIDIFKFLCCMQSRHNIISHTTLHFLSRQQSIWLRCASLTCTLSLWLHAYLSCRPICVAKLTLCFTFTLHSNVTS